MMGLATYVLKCRALLRREIIESGPGSPGDWQRRVKALKLFGMVFELGVLGWVEMPAWRQAEIVASMPPTWPDEGAAGTPPEYDEQGRALVLIRV